MLKMFIYGYLNRIQSSHRLEQEANRNLELIWLLGRLAPDFKTIADFRNNNGEAIRLLGFLKVSVVIGIFPSTHIGECAHCKLVSVYSRLFRSVGLWFAESAVQRAV